MTHLAIDLGTTNCRSEAVFFVPGEASSRRDVRFRTDRGHLADIVDRYGVTTVLIEPCRPAHWVAKHLRSLGVTVQIANTNTEAFRLSGRREKSDRLDAHRLMHLFEQGDFKAITEVSETSLAHRQLLDHRHDVVAQLTSLKCKIRSLLDQAGLSVPKGKNGWTKGVLAQLHTWRSTTPTGVDGGPWQETLGWFLQLFATLSNELTALDTAVREHGKQSREATHLRDAPGVGPIVSLAVSASLDDPHRFRTGKQVSAYSGMAPRRQQSGTMLKQLGISRASWSLLRCYLMEATQIAVYCCRDAWFVLHYERLLAKCGSKKKALCALARRLYVKCWQMLRTGESWASVTRESLAAAVNG